MKTIFYLRDQGPFDFPRVPAVTGHLGPIGLSDELYGRPRATSLSADGSVAPAAAQIEPDAGCNEDQGHPDTSD